MAKKFISVILAALLLAGMFAGCSGKPDEDENKTDENAKIRLSVVGPTTGPNADYGIGFQRAAEMMEELWNAKGGCAGREVEIIVYDDKASIEEDLSLAQMITEDPLNYGTVGHFAGPIAVAPVYEEAGMVYIAPAASAVEFTGIGDYSFRNNYTLQLDAKWLTDIAVDQGYSDCAIVYVQNDWGVSALQTMKDEIDNRSDFSILAEEAVQEGQTDYSVLVEKIKSLGTKCVIIQAFYPIVAPFCSQIKAEIPDVQIFAPGSVYNDEFLKLAGADAAGLICTTAFAAESTEEVAAAFSKDYHDRYGSYPSGQTAQCYDSLGILLTAIESLNGVNDGEAIKNAVEKISYEGICGLTTFDEVHDAHKPRWVVQVVEGGGAWEVLGSVE